jgi:hypothetical protein
VNFEKLLYDKKVSGALGWIKTMLFMNYDLLNLIEEIGIVAL